MKKTIVPTNWVLLNQDGEGTLVDVDKYAIMRRVQIHARDLRILDPMLSYPSTILGREKVIVLNLEVYYLKLFVNYLTPFIFKLENSHLFRVLAYVQHIKAIITAQEVTSYSVPCLIAPFI